MTLQTSRQHRSELNYDAGFLEYDFGPQHPLRPERLEAGLELLQDAKLWNPSIGHRPFAAASDEELMLVHDDEYIAAVQRAGSQRFERGELTQYGLTESDNPAFPGMHRAASLVAGATVYLARRILKGDIDHGFNPAGGLHHALPNRASGFCIYNDPALAAAVASRQYGARVLYVDVDCHHGDGVQWIFYSDPNVLTVSFHESGRYLFPGTGDVGEVGRDDGLGFSVNIPIAPFSQDDDWLDAMHQVVPNLAQRFHADILISAHGADTHVWDPLTHLELTSRSFVEQARLLHDLAHTHASGRWLAVGSGGYDWRRVVPRSWAILWAEMTGQSLPERLPIEWIDRWLEADGSAMPSRFRDDDTLQTSMAEADEVKAINRETLCSVREIHHLR